MKIRGPKKLKKSFSVIDFCKPPECLELCPNKPSFASAHANGAFMGITKLRTLRPSCHCERTSSSSPSPTSSHESSRTLHCEHIEEFPRTRSRTRRRTRPRYCEQGFRKLHASFKNGDSANILGIIRLTIKKTCIS